MIAAVTALVLDDADRVLVVQGPDGNPTLPHAEIQVSQNPVKVIVGHVLDKLGLQLQGYSEVKKFTASGGHTLYGYCGYASGGRLIRFPTKEYLSGSWVDPMLCSRVLNPIQVDILRHRFPGVRA